MFTRRATAGITLGALALATFGAAAPSGADAVTVQFTVSSAGGGLSVASAAATDTLSPATTNLLTTAAISDTLPAVTVTDNRAGLSLANWTVGVSGTTFVNQTDNTITIPASASRIYVAATDLTAATTTGLLGGMLVTGSQTSVGTGNIGTPYTLINGTTAPLRTGSVTFTPTMDVTVPVGAAVGIYKNTVTYTAT